jgi:hypothetical protein
MWKPPDRRRGRFPRSLDAGMILCRARDAYRIQTFLYTYCISC